MNGRISGSGSSSRQQMLEADLFARDLFGDGGPSRPRRAPRYPPYGSRPYRGYREDEADEAEADVEADEGWESEDSERIVAGKDDRVQVLARSTLPSTTLFPFNTICFIQIAGGGHGSGTLIAPRVVITAGHVLQGASSVTITPGFNATAATAADRRPATPNNQVVPSSGFRLHPTLDLGLAILPAAFTKPTRYMMLQPRGDINTATLLTIAGYPGATPGSQVTVNGTMWRHSDKLTITGVTATHLNYPIDTEPGQSGSPLWLLGNNEIRLLLGVHIQGGATANTGVRITCAVLDWIDAQLKAASITHGPVVDNVQRRRVCNK